jgi:transposase
MGQPRAPVTPDAIADEAGAPDASTIRRWVRQYRAERTVEPHHAGGARAALSLALVQVVVGWVLSRAELHVVTTGLDVALFVAEAFSVGVSLTWVSRTLARYGVRSLRSHAVKWEYQTKSSVDALVSFLAEVRQLLRSVSDWDNVVAFDEVIVWENGVVERTYAGQGR